MRRDIPTFKESSHLARYIGKEFRNLGNRPAAGAYQKKEGETYLSVNSTEVETARQIAQFYSDTIEKGPRPIAIASPIVSDYNRAASDSGIMLKFDEQKKYWEFYNHGAYEPAYRHRPGKNKENKSHCGIEFVRILSDRMDFQFAVRMARAATYKMV